MSRFIAALALALLAVAAGCGGDDERAETAPKPPALTIPRSGPETTPAETTAPQDDDPAAAPAPPGAGDGSTPAPQQQQPDSPRNDTPPPAGSPAERFERECEENPAACG